VRASQARERSSAAGKDLPASEERVGKDLPASEERVGKDLPASEERWQMLTPSGQRGGEAARQMV